MDRQMKLRDGLALEIMGVVVWLISPLLLRITKNQSCEAS
jgi:hypothetical protein